jgi:hypothetical protein
MDYCDISDVCCGDIERKNIIVKRGEGFTNIGTFFLSLWGIFSV